NGNMPATTTLTDVLPPGTSLREAWIWDGQNYYEAPPDGMEGDTLTWNLGELKPAEFRNINLTLDIAPDVAAGTVLTNCAQVSILEEDGWPFDDESCAAVTIREPGPNLRVLKDYQWNWEGQLQYEITFYNVGTEELSNVVMTDTLPAGTSYNGWWENNFWEPVTLTHEMPGELAWTIRRIEPGWSSSLRFQADLDAPGVEGLSYTNLVEAPIEGDVFPEDNYAEVTAYTGPDVFAEKWLSGGEPRPGEVVTFTVKFGNQNRWPWSAQEVEYPYTLITDTLPVGMTFITATTPYDPEEGWPPYEEDGHTIVWGIWPMWSDSWWQFEVVAQITDTAAFGDVLVNTVEVQSKYPGYVDPLPDNNLFELPLTILAPVLDVGKTYESNRVAGTVLTYTLTVANSGNAEATGVVLSDTLPAGLTYLEPDGSYDGTDVTWTIAAIAAGGGTAERWFSAELPCLAGQSIVNDTYGVVSSDQGVGAWGDTVSLTTQAPAIQLSLAYEPELALVGETVFFTGTAATNGTALIHEWDFGQGPVSGGLTNSYTFTTTGTYEVSLTATDACGFSREVLVTVDVEEGLHTIYLPIVVKNH
ncbi:MAG: PKD domain-containing protein, partial [Anaerolineae bacterium]|nr:PKD domain-containing protein [Anaerolineae bacterium]